MRTIAVLAAAACVSAFAQTQQPETPAAPSTTVDRPAAEGAAAQPSPPGSTAPAAMPTAAPVQQPQQRVLVDPSYDPTSSVLSMGAVPRRAIPGPTSTDFVNGGPN